MEAREVESKMGSGKNSDHGHLLKAAVLKLYLLVEHHFLRELPLIRPTRRTRREVYRDPKKN